MNLDSNESRRYGIIILSIRTPGFGPIFATRVADRRPPPHGVLNTATILPISSHSPPPHLVLVLPTASAKTSRFPEIPRAPLPPPPTPLLPSPALPRRSCLFLLSWSLFCSVLCVSVSAYARERVRECVRARAWESIQGSNSGAACLSMGLRKKVPTYIATTYLLPYHL